MVTTVLLGLLCCGLLWLAHALGSWRLALLLYALPALAAWHLGAPWLAAVLGVSVAGLMARA